MADSEKIKASVQKKAKNKVKRKVKSKARSKVKKISPLTFVICFLCLAAGVGAGIGAYSFISRDDCFRLKGEKSYTVSVGTPLTYGDEGVKIIEFGKDISGDVKIKTNLTEIGDGKYTADTSEPGEYYIIYTVDSPKYGNIQRVRTISVKGEG
ncbi:MAG: hypothetical protein IJ038_01170 [Clostridia bacterium]|nr:hypothetical protein [Clostridia bacterium]